MRFYVIVLIAFVAFSCRDGAVYEEYYHVGSEEWCVKDTARFNVVIPSAGTYTMEVCLRHTTDYEMANLWCFVHGRDSLQQVFGDTVNIKVAETDGRWIGSGSSLKVVEQLMNKRSVSLPKGEYTFTIQQAMRIKCLKGVKDVGLKIEHLTSSRR